MLTNVPANDAERTGELAPTANLPTRHGLFRIHVFTDAATGLEHVDKIAQLSRAGIPVVARIPHVIEPGALNHAYLEAKARRSGHLLYPNGRTRV